jgi:hypothetical protein
VWSFAKIRRTNFSRSVSEPGLIEVKRLHAAVLIICSYVFERIGALPMPSETQRAESDPQEPVPFMQRVLDDPFLLLFVGVTIPTVLYLLWGVIEVASIPIAK